MSSPESFRCSVGWSESVDGVEVLLESPEADPELLSLASRRWSVGLSGSLAEVLEPLLDEGVPVVVLPEVVLLELEPEPLSLPSFRCSVGLSASVVDELLDVPESELSSFR